MARRKAEAADVPQSQVEAVAMIAEYVASERATLRDRVMAEAAIDAIKANLAAVVAVREVDQKSRFAALKSWWEAGGKEKAGKARSTEIAGIKIGVRLSPPKVKFAKGYSAEKALAWLKGLRWPRKSGFIRTKVELDKQAIIKAVQGDEAIGNRFSGVLGVVQSDEFFIDAGLDEEAIRKELAVS